MPWKKILAELHNFPADGMSISLESKDLYNIDPVIFQEVTKIQIYGTQYGPYYTYTFFLLPKWF